MIAEWTTTTALRLTLQYVDQNNSRERASVGDDGSLES